jgi:hypothetical protein
LGTGKKEKGKGFFPVPESGKTPIKSKKTGSTRA